MPQRPLFTFQRVASSDRIATSLQLPDFGSKRRLTTGPATAFAQNEGYRGDHRRMALHFLRLSPAANRFVGLQVVRRADRHLGMVNRMRRRRPRQ